MRAATEGSLPPVMPQGNLVEVLGREVRQGSPGELMVESAPSRQRRPPCKTNKEMSDEAADAAALTYLLTYGAHGRIIWFIRWWLRPFFLRPPIPRLHLPSKRLSRFWVAEGGGGTSRPPSSPGTYFVQGNRRKAEGTCYPRLGGGA